jgi:hypothetical protein
MVEAVAAQMAINPRRELELQIKVMVVVRGAIVMALKLRV